MSHAHHMPGMGPVASSDSTMNMSSTEPGVPLMSAASMAMVFFRSATTPLYSSAWTPSSLGPYAGTCLFLVVMGVFHRVLIALRNILFHPPPPPHGKLMALHHEDLYPDVKGPQASPWRRVRRAIRAQPLSLGTEAARASLEVAIGGVGYLLMLAVMTMNLGYFLAVLGGLFLGVFVAGRFAADEGDSCH